MFRLQNLFLPERIIPFIISLAFFMESLDATVLNSAIPVIAHSLQVHPINLKISLITYLLSLAIFIPISGWMADKFGVKKIFITAILIFTISSFFCGISTNIFELSAARFIQGIGGALNLPVGRLIILRYFKGKNILSIMNQVIMVGAFGMMMGPLLGGFISQYFSWQWIFWINLPVGLFAAGLAYYWLPKFPFLIMPPLDTIGFILFGSSLACLTLGASELSETSLSINTPLIIILSAVLLFLIYIWHSKHQEHPIVKVKLLKQDVFRISVIGNFFSRLVFSSVPFVMPLLLQLVFGYSPHLSGILLSPLAIGVMLAKPLSILLLRQMGYKWLLITNSVFAGLVILTFTMITIHTPIIIIGSLMLLYGIFVSLQFGAVNTLGYSDTAHEDLSAATSIVSTCQQLAQSLGVALCALILRVISSVFSENFLLTTFTFDMVFVVLSVMMLFTAWLFTKLNLVGNTLPNQVSKQA